MRVDFVKLGAMMKADRGKMPQKKYAAQLGLDQGAVSKLESGQGKRLSLSVAELLRRRIKEIPVLPDGEAVEIVAVEPDGATPHAAPPNPDGVLVSHLEVRALRDQLAEVQRTLARHQDQIAQLGDARKKLLTALIQSRRPVTRKKKRGASG